MDDNLLVITYNSVISNLLFEYTKIYYLKFKDAISTNTD